MNIHETFGQCLQRILGAMGVSASEAARLVNFRSRNSIFRILGDDTSWEVDARFLESLRQAVGDQWPETHFHALEEALDIKRVGFEQHVSNRAFFRVLHGPEKMEEYQVDVGDGVRPLEAFLNALMTSEPVEIVLTGCFDDGLSRLLCRCWSGAGDAGRLTIRHYIDADEHMVVRNFLGVLPLVSKPWYNARLVDRKTCPYEMMAIYRQNSILIKPVDAASTQPFHQLIRYDARHFIYRQGPAADDPILSLLDRWRYDLPLLKPVSKAMGGTEDFVAYTADLMALEHDCTILSVKPDIHFNCVPCDVLRPAILEGFRMAQLADGDALAVLMERLETIHEARIQNITGKRSATHLVYSLPAMERFMETGLQTDHFFIQRAYTLAERREIMILFREAMLNNPAFNIHFLREGSPALCNEITLYKGKGVMMLDAYSGYALGEDHSEALIRQPAFMNRFYRFFMDELLQKHVMPRAETLSILERWIRSGER